MVLKIIYNIGLLKRIIIINLYMKINYIMRKSKILFFVVIMLFECSVNAQDTLRLRVMTYNIRFGELATVDRLAEHIKSFKPDFVALEEVDVNTDRSLAPHQNGRNIISELAGDVYKRQILLRRYWGGKEWYVAERGYEIIIGVSS